MKRTKMRERERERADAHGRNRTEEEKSAGTVAERERKAPYTFAIQCDPEQFGVCTDTGTQSRAEQSSTVIQTDRRQKLLRAAKR